MYGMKWRKWTMLLLLLSLNLSGCASNAPRVGVEYCEHARVIWFDSQPDVDVTLPSIRCQINEKNGTVERLCREFRAALNSIFMRFS